MSAAPALFDAVLAVDWSAASRPARGADSIWIAAHERGRGLTALENPSTRAEAMAWIAERLAALRAEGRRALVGFDFPLGLPRGAAARLFDAPGWRAVWTGLARELRDGEDNANDRFEAADRMVWRGAPFWGHPAGRRYAALGATRGSFAELSETRAAERCARARGARPKSVWQLHGAGSVGGQALTGIPALERLRRDPRLAPHLQVWPFETGLEAPEAPLVLAEIYPSLLASDGREAVKDAGQVRAMAAALAALDEGGELAELFRGPRELSGPDREAAAREEGWILGLGFEARLRAAGPASSPAADPDAEAATPSPPAPQPDGPPASGPAAPAIGPRRPEGRWERDPAAIYARSFEIVRAETRLERFEPEMAELAIRVVHACGDPGAADRLAWSPGAAAAGRAALAARAPVICDAAMVAQGIIRRALPAGAEVIAALDHPGCAVRAKAERTTRSAAAMELAAERLEGAVVAIGNAPTALFRLLELIDAGAPRPALILGFPVGFVGAAESKAALAADPRGIPFVALRGRRGGSAMAAAAVNALALGLRGDGLAVPGGGA